MSGVVKKFTGEIIYHDRVKAREYYEEPPTSKILLIGIWVRQPPLWSQHGMRKSFLMPTQEFEHLGICVKCQIDGTKRASFRWVDTFDNHLCGVSTAGKGSGNVSTSLDTGKARDKAAEYGLSPTEAQAVLAW